MTNAKIKKKKKKERKFEVHFSGSLQSDSGHGDLSELFNCKMNSTAIR